MRFAVLHQLFQNIMRRAGTMGNKAFCMLPECFIFTMHEGSC
jgi:hypothetical protein